ncbi:alpha/beta fold hydrolase [Solimonas sp. K1W22B-7]|uniref:alpha/beta fold hydrolase n=1 Tax=Solimonas sp. K1W22B-7 TaxID=2303331 RepID=UPI0013C4F81B|nr:alpha/beta hydrolase [Solimonas sp. K1W22B-7]
MKRETFQHRLADGSHACVHRWLPARARGVVQVVHGMAEHGARYDRLAQALASAGYAVYAQDLPGHGRSVRAADELGHFADRGGWGKTLSAINSVRALAEQELQHLPHFMLGHSMGSFLLQDYVVEHGQGLAGALFSATSGDLGPLRTIGLNLLRVEALWFGGRHRSALAEQLTFKDFNRRFKPARTDFEWLSRDPAEVDLYIRDARCGFRCSNSLWISLMEMGGRLGDQKRLARIPKDLPVMIIAGSDDPACQGEKGPRALEAHYRKAGLSDVAVRIWMGGRHELLNDICRDQVTAELLGWFDKKLGS